MVKDKIKNLLNSMRTLAYKILPFFYALSAENKRRIASSLILIPVALYAIFVSQNLFTLLIIIAAVLMGAEWADMTHKMPNRKKWHLLGFLYISIPLFCVYKLRLMNTDILFWMFSIIWVTDIFAFFFGKVFGGTKLAINISPGKTWCGLLGGVLASSIIGFISGFIFNGGVVFFIFASIFLSLVEQVSDLIESKFKRIFGVKDSGNIIPGHGGVLDRLDGVMLTAPVVLLMTIIYFDKF